jgi:hypothetical protein
MTSSMSKARPVTSALRELREEHHGRGQQKHAQDALCGVP